MEDGKALSLSSTFWNGLLEDNLMQNIDFEETTISPKFDRTIGYVSEMVSSFCHTSTALLAQSKLIKEPILNNAARNGNLVGTCNKMRVGQSHFKISSHFTLSKVRPPVISNTVTNLNTPHQTLSSIKEELIENEVSVVGKSNSRAITSMKIKSEPQDEPIGQSEVLLFHQPILVKHELHISSADATASHDYAATPTAQHQLVQILGAQTINTALRTSKQKIITTPVFPAGSTLSQMNGPAGKLICVLLPFTCAVDC